MSYRLFYQYFSCNFSRAVGLDVGSQLYVQTCSPRTLDTGIAGGVLRRQVPMRLKRRQAWKSVWH